MKTLEEKIPQASPFAVRDEWLPLVKQTGGCIDDQTFERPRQGEYEDEDEWE